MTWDEFRHLHKRPQVIARWRQWLGPVLQWLTPGRRRFLLCLGAALIAVKIPFEEVRRSGKWFGVTTGSTDVFLVMALLFAYVFGCYRAAQKFASLPGFVRRHPLLTLHAGFWVLLVVLWTTRPSNPTLLVVLAGCAIAMPFLLWRLSYLMLTAQRGKLSGTRVTDHAFYIWPAWGGSETPYGKGFDYLKSTEAHNEEALARSQLAGLKLFILALMCMLGEGLIEGLVFGEDNAFRRTAGGATLDIPMVDTLLAEPGRHPVWQGWVAVYCDLFRLVLRLGAKGHLIIGCLRLCGFNVFRNTYKPLLAETVVEFWNRYYYYFKELLVNFFFFPTFTRYFKRNPHLRLFVAVFAAAFLGNMYYHVIQSAPLVKADWPALWAKFNPRLCYCFLLALGIYVSMYREQRRPKGVPRPPARRALAIFGVWTFFSLIRLWHGGEASQGERLKFLLGLFGLA